MLVGFSVENFRSIKNKQTLLMTADSKRELNENTFKINNSYINSNLLKTIVIYGPNASGKSNILKALEAMHYFIITSSKKLDGEKIKREPFLFDSISKDLPSSFEISIIIENILYEYGFSLTEDRIHSEWLYSYPKNRPRTLFYRNYNSEKKEYEWDVKISGQRKVIQGFTRSNALFLSTAVQLNNEQLKPVFEWFNTKFFSYLDVSYKNDGLIVDLLKKNDSLKNSILDFLRVADPSIIDFRIKKEKFTLNVDMLDQEIKSTFKTEYLEKISKTPSEDFRTFFIHRSKCNEGFVELDFYEESDGTKKIWDLAYFWLIAFGSGAIILYDELDKSVHPTFVEFLITLFHNPKANIRNAQLIFATHNSSLLSKKLFRRDQIWFTEKDEENSTQLYPLSDFKPRKEEALERGYLNGRYGAIPFIGGFDFNG